MSYYYTKTKNQVFKSFQRTVSYGLTHMFKIMLINYLHIYSELVRLIEFIKMIKICMQNMHIYILQNIGLNLEYRNKIEMKFITL